MIFVLNIANGFDDVISQRKVALWELPRLGEDVGVFLWFHHKNTPTYTLYHGDSQRPRKVSGFCEKIIERMNQWSM